MREGWSATCCTDPMCYGEGGVVCEGVGLLRGEVLWE